MDQEGRRLEELLVDQITGDLDASGEAELATLAGPASASEQEALALVAGELAAAALSGREEALPPELARLIASQGETLLHPEATMSLDMRPAPADQEVPRAPRSARPVMAWTGWAAAAALALWLLLPGSTRTGADLAQLRDSLLADSSLVLAWTATEDPAATAASGDVVWDTDGTAGMMRIVGLEANDPTVQQYQLWIFDATRDERFPVDGGVFDIPAGASEVLVPIRPAVAVGEATLFAVTVERPGGVVVSERERIVLVAEVS